MKAIDVLKHVQTKFWAALPLSQKPSFLLRTDFAGRLNYEAAPPEKQVNWLHEGVLCPVIRALKNLNDPHG